LNNGDIALPSLGIVFENGENGFIIFSWGGLPGPSFGNQLATSALDYPPFFHFWRN
jgi:hypothetical protein